jgi:hypothetical protein
LRTSRRREQRVLRRRSSRARGNVVGSEPEPDSGPEVSLTAEEVINGRGKRGRKRRSVVQEVEEPEEPEEPEPEVARMTGAPVPWRAPVARMI